MASNCCGIQGRLLGQICILNINHPFVLLISLLELTTLFILILFIVFHSMILLSTMFSVEFVMKLLSIPVILFISVFL